MPQPPGLPVRNHTSVAPPGVAGSWRQHHRQRLVNWSQHHRDVVDAEFTAYRQCAPGVCARMREEYGREAPPASWAQHARFKYQASTRRCIASYLLGWAPCGSASSHSPIAHGGSRLSPKPCKPNPRQVVVDGNGAADRLAPALCSGSLVLLASLARQWFSFRLTPGEHYLPVQ